MFDPWTEPCTAPPVMQAPLAIVTEPVSSFPFCLNVTTKVPEPEGPGPALQVPFHVPVRFVQKSSSDFPVTVPESPPGSPVTASTAMPLSGSSGGPSSGAAPGHSQPPSLWQNDPWLFTR